MSEKLDNNSGNGNHEDDGNRSNENVELDVQQSRDDDRSGESISNSIATKAKKNSDAGAVSGRVGTRRGRREEGNAAFSGGEQLLQLLTRKKESGQSHHHLYNVNSSVNSNSGRGLLVDGNRKPLSSSHSAMAMISSAFSQKNSSDGVIENKHNTHESCCRTTNKAITTVATTPTTLPSSPPSSSSSLSRSVATSLLSRSSPSLPLSCECALPTFKKRKTTHDIVNHNTNSVDDAPSTLSTTTNSISSHWSSSPFGFKHSSRRKASTTTTTATSLPSFVGEGFAFKSPTSGSSALLLQRSKVPINEHRDSNSNAHRATVEDLPFEIIVKIFSYLSFQEQVRLSLVCSTWKDASLIELRIATFTKDVPLPKRMIKFLARRCGSLTQLSLPSEFNPSDFKYVAELKNLHYLEIYSAGEKNH